MNHFQYFLLYYSSDLSLNESAWKTIAFGKESIDNGLMYSVIIGDLPPADNHFRLKAVMAPFHEIATEICTATTSKIVKNNLSSGSPLKQDK